MPADRPVRPASPSRPLHSSTSAITSQSHLEGSKGLSPWHNLDSEIVALGIKRCRLTKHNQEASVYRGPSDPFAIAVLMVCAEWRLRVMWAVMKQPLAESPCNFGCTQLRCSTSRREPSKPNRSRNFPFPAKLEEGYRGHNMSDSGTTSCAPGRRQ